MAVAEDESGLEESDNDPSESFVEPSNEPSAEEEISYEVAMPFEGITVEEESTEPQAEMFSAEDESGLEENDNEPSESFVEPSNKPSAEEEISNEPQVQMVVAEDESGLEENDNDPSESFVEEPSNEPSAEEEISYEPQVLMSVAEDESGLEENGNVPSESFVELSNEEQNLEKYLEVKSPSCGEESNERNLDTSSGRNNSTEYEEETVTLSPFSESSNEADAEDDAVRDEKSTEQDDVEEAHDNLPSDELSIAHDEKSATAGSDAENLETDLSVAVPKLSAVADNTSTSAPIDPFRNPFDAEMEDEDNNNYFIEKTFAVETSAIDISETKDTGENPFVQSLDMMIKNTMMSQNADAEEFVKEVSTRSGPSESQFSRRVQAGNALEASDQSDLSYSDDARTITSEKSTKSGTETFGIESDYNDLKKNDAGLVSNDEEPEEPEMEDSSTSFSFVQTNEQSNDTQSIESGDPIKVNSTEDNFIEEETSDEIDQSAIKNKDIAPKKKRRGLRDLLFKRFSRRQKSDASIEEVKNKVIEFGDAPTSSGKESTSDDEDDLSVDLSVCFEDAKNNASVSDAEEIVDDISAINSDGEENDPQGNNSNTEPFDINEKASIEHANDMQVRDNYIETSATDNDDGIFPDHANTSKEIKEHDPDDIDVRAETIANDSKTDEENLDNDNVHIETNTETDDNGKRGDNMKLLERVSSTEVNDHVLAEIESTNDHTAATQNVAMSTTAATDSALVSDEFQTEDKISHSSEDAYEGKNDEVEMFRVETMSSFGDDSAVRRSIFDDDSAVRSSGEEGNAKSSVNSQGGAGLSDINASKHIVPEEAIVLKDSHSYDESIFDEDGENKEETSAENLNSDYGANNELFSMDGSLDSVLDEGSKQSFVGGARQSKVDNFEKRGDEQPLLRSSSSLSSTSTDFVSYQSPPGATSNTTTHLTDLKQYERRVEIEMSPDFLPQIRPKILLHHNAGRRLYVQGMELERKKALDMKRMSELRNNSRKLTLATRNRSASAPRSNMSRNGESVYARLYSIAKQREEMPNPTVQYASTKTLVPARSWKGSRQEKPAYERLYNLAKKKKAAEIKARSENGGRSTSRVRASSKANGRMSTNERLYNLAKKKREIEETRRRIRAEEELAERNKPKKLVFATRKYNTPVRERNHTGASIHSRLYDLASIKKAADTQRSLEKREEESRNLGSVKKYSRSQSRSSSARLYSRSLSMQEEGFKRRQEIERRNKKSFVHNNGRKISLGKATGIYERGMIRKMELEMKREDEAIDPYVSPLLNPLVTEDETEEFSDGESGPTMHYRSSSASRSYSRSRQVNDRDRPQSGSGSRVRSGSQVRGRSSTPLSSARSRSNSLIRKPAGSSQRDSSAMRDSSRIRSRSRMRHSTPTTFSFRQPSPARVPAAPRVVKSQNVRTHSDTPQRAIRQNTTRDLLRKMESDQGFFNKVKQALALKEKEEGQNDDASYENESDPQTPTGKLLLTTPSSSPGSGLKLPSDLSNSTFTTGNETPSESSTPNTSYRYLVRPRSAEYCD